MKWIKLFEQYTQEDKVEAANVVYMSFEFIKKFDKMEMMKVKDSNGDTFYWYDIRGGKHTVLHHFGGTHLASAYLNIVIDSSEKVYVTGLFSVDLLSAFPILLNDSWGLVIRNKALHLLLTSNSERLSEARCYRIERDQEDRFSKVRRKLSIKWNEKF